MCAEYMATIERPSSNEVSLYHKKEHQDLPGGQESRNRKEGRKQRSTSIRISGTRLEKELHVRVMTGGGGQTADHPNGSDGNVPYG